MTGPRMIGEKPTSPAKMGVYWWVVIVVVIDLNTAFPRQGGRRLPPITVAVPEVAITCPKHRRLRSPHRDRLIFRRDGARLLDFHPLLACLHRFCVCPALGTRLRRLSVGSHVFCVSGLLGSVGCWACFSAANLGTRTLAAG